MIKIGSLFSGIGGFELGLERAIPGAETIWQVEQNKYCQSILKKHWPNATIYSDVRNITQHNVEPVDILIGGFPCQSISVSGKQEGLKNENKSGLWWEFLRIISELRPRIVVMENVPNIVHVGGRDVVGSLAQIGYDAEWTIISAQQFGAPHLRKRWFCVAYPNTRREKSAVQTRRQESFVQTVANQNVTNSIRNNGKISIKRRFAISEKKFRSNGEKWNFWKESPTESPLCRVDDGISFRVARLKALGNAIVPQCSEWVGQQIVKSGLLQELS